MRTAGLSAECVYVNSSVRSLLNWVSNSFFRASFRASAQIILVCKIYSPAVISFSLLSVVKIQSFKLTSECWLRKAVLGLYCAVIETPIFAAFPKATLFNFSGHLPSEYFSHCGGKSNWSKYRSRLVPCMIFYCSSLNKYKHKPYFCQHCNKIYEYKV